MLRPVGTQDIQIAFPAQLTPEVFNALLLFEAQQCPQPQLHRLAFRLQARYAEDFPHQFVINFDACSHHALSVDV